MARSKNTFLAGGETLNTKTLTSGTYTVDPLDRFLFLDTSAGNITLNFPKSALWAGGLISLIKISGSNIITIDPFGSETINGEASTTFDSNNRFLEIISNGSNLYFVGPAVRFQTLIDDVNPAASVVGSVVTVASSASTFFDGRKTIFFLSTTAQNLNATDEFMLADYFIQIDGGTNERICQWSSSVANEHACYSGTLINNPLVGNHTINFRAQRITGAGTLTWNTNDYIRLTCLSI